MKTFECERCGKILTQLDLKVGDAVVVDGSYVCSRCRPKFGRGTKVLAVVLCAAVIVPLLVMGILLLGRVSELERQASSARTLEGELRDEISRRDERIGRLERDLDTRLAALQAATAESMEQSRRDLRNTDSAVRAIDDKTDRLHMLLTQFMGQDRSREKGPEKPEEPPAADAKEPEAGGLPGPERAPEAKEPPEAADAEPAKGHLDMFPGVVSEDPPGDVSPPGVEIRKKIEACREELESREVSKRFRAVRRLSLMNDSRAIPVLIEALKDVNSEVRSLAARSLGKSGSRDAVSPLIDVLDDPDPFVRYSAYDAVVTITGTRLEYHSGGDRGARASEIEAIRAWWDKRREP